MTTYQPYRPHRRPSTASSSTDYDDSDPSAILPYSLFPNGDYSLSRISLTGYALGTVSGAALCGSVYLLSVGSAFAQTCVFVLALCVFHFLEFWTTATYNTLRANYDSYLLTNNGWQYTAAHTVSLLESILENLFFPNLKLHLLPTLLGLSLMLLGQTLRSTAMCTAGPSFTHLVARKKRSTHTLVTHGIYSVLRHPSYTGYFYWAVGSQIMLGNPFCTVVFIVVLVRFFGRRIQAEEKYLVSFFGEEYERYRAGTRILIPGVGW